MPPSSLLPAAVIATAVFAGLAGCAIAAELDGVVETQDYAVDPFTSIEANGSGDVSVQVGPEASVTATGDTALLERLRVSVEGDVLHLDGPSGTIGWSSEDIAYAITVPHLDAVELSGSGDVDVTDVETDAFSARTSGSGDIVLSGRADSLAIELDGSGRVDADALDARDARVDLSGSGDIRVRASGDLDVDISGSGDVTTVGAASVAADVSGSGEVHEG